MASQDCKPLVAESPGRMRPPPRLLTLRRCVMLAFAVSAATFGCGIPSAQAALQFFSMRGPAIGRVDRPVGFSVNAELASGLPGTFELTVNWGDGGEDDYTAHPTDGSIIAHTYLSPGTYAWDATAEDPHGGSPVYVSGQIVIRAPEPTPEPLPDPPPVTILPVPLDIFKDPLFLPANLRVLAPMTPGIATTLVLDWGDGKLQEQAVPAGSGYYTLELSHTYEPYAPLAYKTFAVTGFIKESAALSAVALILHFC